MRSSYRKEDVCLLLKDITGCLPALSTEEREKNIQAGVHYSEMLPLEKKPTEAYLALYEQALQQHGLLTASAIKTVSEKIKQKKGNRIVLVSLARAGTPVGVLIKRYLEKQYQLSVPHYTISIIRGRGIDDNAIAFLLQKHWPEELQFIDGWIGKGAIIRELQKEAARYPGVSGELAVLADPARLTALCGTSEDFLIPSACLNAVVSGLFSRTILNRAYIGEKDFHGAVYLEELEKLDKTNAFLDTVAGYFDRAEYLQESAPTGLTGMEEARKIAEHFQIQDINFIKPGIGETTRVLLRRVPWKILVRDKSDNSHIGHIKKLCQEKNICLEEYPLQNYRACGLIKNLNQDV